MSDVSNVYAISRRLAAPAFGILMFSAVFLFGGYFSLMHGALPMLCAILLLCALGYPLRLPAMGQGRLLLAGVLLPVALFFIWVGMQLMPFGHTSTWAHSSWSLVPQAPWASISLSPGITLAHLSYTLGYAIFAFSIYKVATTQPARIIGILAAIATLASLYGLYVFATGNQSVLWLPKTSYQDSLSATFINRNSFATFAGLGILACMAMALQRVGEISGRLSPLQRIKAFGFLVFKPGWPWLVAALVCLVALILTNSRAGIMASLCGILVLLGSLAGMRAPARWPLVGMILTIFIAAIIVVSAVGGVLGARLLRVNADTSIRNTIYMQTSQIIAQNPVTGSGLGTYPQAFSAFRTPEMLTFNNAHTVNAHNTYLELMADLGYTGAAFLAVAVISLIIALVQGLIIRRRAIIWPALGVSALVLVGGHALADFSLSIPAVTLTALAVLMVALAQSFPLKENPAPRINPACVAALSVIAVSLIGFSGWQTAANWQAFKAEPTVRTVTDGKPARREDLFLAQHHLRNCLAINPWHPTCQTGLAQTSLALATSYGLKGAYGGVGLVYLNMARDQYLHALNKSPAQPLAWYRLARIDAYLGNTEQANLFLANSLLTGPAEPFISVPRVSLMLSLLPGASPENATLYTSSINAIWQAMPGRVGAEIRQNPAIIPTFANTIQPDTQTPDLWKRHIRTPYPLPQAAAPLGE